MCRIIILLLVLFLSTNDFVTAQQVPAQKDSTKLYKDIETYSKQKKFTKFLYNLFFRPVAIIAPNAKVVKKDYTKLKQKPNRTFEGKIIRNINIITLDPFGYTIGDTIVSRKNFLINSGNALHAKSKNFTIRNLLLIRPNQIFDSLLVKESERLVRSQRFVQDVSFFVLATAKNSDSVDIYIRELDNWSIVPRIAASTSRFTLVLTDKNFLGFGHEFQNGFTWYHATGEDAYNTRYYIPNIRNTYINSTFYYGTDEYRNFTKSFAVDRPFYSPFTKWAAGINFTQQFRNDSIYVSDTLYVPQKFKSNIQDYWAGNAIQISKGNSEKSRTTNFISAVRYLQVHYLEKPDQSIDTLHFFSDDRFYLASIGISKRTYVQDKYIFKFGVTEDVPVGKVYSITGGYLEKNSSGRLYLGARAATGKYYPWGYLSFNLEYGTFFRSSKTQEGILAAGANYFTGLFEIGNWKFRQFVKPRVTIGLNRLVSDSLTLNDGYGLDGFNSAGLTGTQRLLLTFQTQTYAPWNLIGFRFGPYFIYSVGMLSNTTSGFKDSRLYSQIGLGLLIKNENLIINTFQISISYYPNIPGNGQNLFKVNSFRTTDFGFRDFEIGKPSVMVFQ